MFTVEETVAADAPVAAIRIAATGSDRAIKRFMSIDKPSSRVPAGERNILLLVPATRFFAPPI
jgi:hypothetical protein